MSDKELELLREQRVDPDILLSKNYPDNGDEIVSWIGTMNQSLNGRRNNERLTKRQKKDITNKIEVNKKFRTYLRSLKAYSRSQEGSGCATLHSNIKERIQVLLGEIEAGNTSPEIRKELKRLLLYLLKQKEITKDDYSNIIEVYNIE